ncbi:MAG: hypothetical protein ACU841_08970 [Gammaproteobacteria bacterium]
MKKLFLFAASLFFYDTAMAVTDHYLLREGNHVQHLKITRINDKIMASADVNFEANPDEPNAIPCSGEVSGDARMEGDNLLVFKQHSVSEANYCELRVELSENGAAIKQSKHCDNFVTGICRFSSNGKELVKIQ